MSWTDERVETLKRMWMEGRSASQIAKELEGVTRNAVIGKVHRLGLSNRSTGGATKPNNSQKKSPPQKTTPKSVTLDNTTETEKPQPIRPIPRPKLIITAGQPLPPQPSANEVSPEALATVKEIEKKAKKLSVMELTERTCKWPVGDPATENFWFCGLPAQTGKPYCEAHVGVAFQPMTIRREKRR